MNSEGTELYLAVIRLIGPENKNGPLADYTNANYRIRNMCLSVEKLALAQAFQELKILIFSHAIYIRGTNIQRVLDFVAAIYQNLYMQGIYATGIMPFLQFMDWRDSGLKSDLKNIELVPVWGEVEEKGQILESGLLEGLRFIIDPRAMIKHPDGTVLSRDGKKVPHISPLSPSECEKVGIDNLLELYWMRPLADEIKEALSQVTGDLWPSPKELFNRIYQENSAGGSEEALAIHLKTTLNLFERAFEGENGVYLKKN